MTKVPFKWGKVGNDGKAEINAEDTSTFSAQSPALKVNGDVEADNITEIDDRLSDVETSLEEIYPSGTLKTTSPISIVNGKVSGLESGTGRFYSNGLAFSNPQTANNAFWIKTSGTTTSNTNTEIGMGNTAGVLYLRQYNSSNLVTKEVTLLDRDGNTIFPGSLTAHQLIINAGETPSNEIQYTGGNYTLPVIKFLTGDSSGHGIIIGGGGVAAICGGESNSVVSQRITGATEENLYLGSDGKIVFLTNCQAGALGTIVTELNGDTFSGKCSYASIAQNAYNADEASKANSLIERTATTWFTRSDYNTELKRSNASWLTVWNADSTNKVYDLRSLNIDRLSSCTQVFSGNLTTGSTSFSYKDSSGEILYNYYIIV